MKLIIILALLSTACQRIPGSPSSPSGAMSSNGSPSLQPVTVYDDSGRAWEVGLAGPRGNYSSGYYGLHDRCPARTGLPNQAPNINSCAYENPVTWEIALPVDYGWMLTGGEPGYAIHPEAMDLTRVTGGVRYSSVSSLYLPPASGPVYPGTATDPNYPIGPITSDYEMSNGAPGSILEWYWDPDYPRSLYVKFPIDLGRCGSSTPRVNLNGQTTWIMTIAHQRNC